MSEIKFVCPHCGQHVACDRDYGGWSVECPSCRQVLIVPRLTGGGYVGSDAMLVAATPGPPPSSPDRQELGLWTEEAWERHAAEHPGGYLGKLAWRVHALILGPILGAWLLAPWVPRSLVKSAPYLWISGSLLCAAWAAWLILSRSTSAPVLRALAAVPLTAGILAGQIAMSGPAGCCLGALR